MSWAKLDDQYPDHPKIVAVGPLGMALHTAALCYCARYLTDGFVPAAMISRLVSFDGIYTVSNGVSNAVSHNDVTAELTKAGLFDEVPGGFKVHDYLDYNPPAEQVKTEKAANAKRQKEFRHKGRGTGGKFGSNGVSNGVTNALVTPAPSPSPSPVKNSLSAQPDQSEPDRDEPLPVLSEKFISLTGIQPYNLEKWTEAQQTMARAGVTPRELEAAYRKMEQDGMSVSGLWSVVKTAISVHARAMSGKPIYSDGRRSGRPLPSGIL